MRVDDLQPMWVNPFDVDHYDPENANNPKNAMYNICRIIHSADMYLSTTEKGSVKQEDILQMIDTLNQLSVLAKQELSNSNGKGR